MGEFGLVPEYGGRWPASQEVQLLVLSPLATMWHGTPYSSPQFPQASDKEIDLGGL